MARPLLFLILRKEDAMTTRAMRLMVTTLALGLASASLIEAGPRPRHERRDPLRALAFNLEESTRQVYQLAARTSHRRSWRDQRALSQLRRLERQAHRFSRDLRHFGAMSARVERDYRDLQRAYQQARRAFPALRPYRRTEREFRRTSGLMRELRHVYRARLAHSRRGPRGHRAGPGDRDGYVEIGMRRDNGHAVARFRWDDD
jgi:hypothetical protein